MKVYRGKKYIYAKPRFGPSKFARIPVKLNSDIACLAGIIIGDGNLSKDKQRITIELVDKKLLVRIQQMVYYIFKKNVNIHKRIDKRINRKTRYFININNAVIYDLMNKTFEIPKGKKSNIVMIPSMILKSSKRIKKAFLVGILVADGGRRWWRKIGFSSSNKKLRDSVSQLLNEIKVKHNKDEWINKRYKKYYFGIYFDKEQLINLTRGCRSGQTGQILESFLDKIQRPSLGD